MVSGTLQEKATIGQITFKILNDSGSIPLKLEMRELVAYTPDGTETDLMDTVKTGKRQRFHQSAYNRPCHNQAHHNSA